MKMTAPQFHVFKFSFVKMNKSLSNNIAFFFCFMRSTRKTRMLECFPSIMRPVCIFCVSFWFMNKKKNNKNNKKRKIKQMKMNNNNNNKNNQ